MSSSIPQPASSCRSETSRDAAGRFLVLSLLLLGLGPESGRASTALTFPPAASATKAFVELPRPEVFNLTTNFTLEAWVKVSAFTTHSEAILTKGDSAWGLARFGETDKVSFRTFNGIALAELPSQTDFRSNTWHHVAAVYDGLRKQLYVDGVLEASAEYRTPVAVNDYPVLIGRNAQNTGRNFGGTLDGVRIWSVARSAAEILSTTNRFLRGSEVGLLGAWDFEGLTNGPAGTLLALDTSSQGLHGVLNQLGTGPLTPGIPMLPPLSGAFGLRFNNSGSNRVAGLTIAHHPDFEFGSEMTFETWILLNSFSAPEGYTVVAGAEGSWQLSYANGTGETRGRLRFETSTGGATTELISGRTLPLLEWHHVAVVLNQTNRQLFIDGVLDVQTSSGPSAITPVAGTKPGLFVGSPSGSPLDAQLDELRLWRRARSSDAIAGNYFRKLNGNEPGLVCWLDCNSVEPGTLRDVKTFDPHHATLFPQMTTRNWIEGVLPLDPRPAAYSLYFNGVSDYVTIAQPVDRSLLRFTNLTLEAWIKPQANPTASFKTNGFRNVMIKQDNGYGLALDDQNHLCFWIGAGNPGQFVRSGSVITNEVWQHVAVVVDTLHNETRFYINGSSDPTRDVVPGVAILRNETGPLILGRQGSSSANYYKGWMAELRLWQTAHSAQEIATLYARTLPPGSASLGGYWDFSDGQGLTLSDRSGNGLSGTLSMSGKSWDVSAGFDATPLPVGLNLLKNPLAAGLWVGHVTLSGVCELQSAIGKKAPVTPVAHAADLRILLHVDGSGTVRLLKEVTLMQKPASSEGSNILVLVTDPTRIPLYQGIIQKNGKWIGKRFTAVAFDFDGDSLELGGGVGPGSTCLGNFTLDANAPTNPFRHRFNPQHSTGYAINRELSLKFATRPPGTFSAGTEGSVDTLSGEYQEILYGLHKIPLITQGAVNLSRISATPTLN